MDLGLRGKVALVAAASRGLGRAIAFELANEGAKVVMCARGADALEAARAEIAAQTGADVRAVVADLVGREQIDLVAQAALSGVRPRRHSRDERRRSARWRVREARLGRVGAGGESDAAQRGRAHARGAARECANGNGGASSTSRRSP